MTRRMRPPIQGEVSVDLCPKIKVPTALFVRLARHADRRNITEGKVIEAVIKAVLDDDIVDAVLNDGCG